MLVLAVHLFGRVRRSWLDPAALGLATAAMLLTFFGINLLKWGMHRYWPSRGRPDPTPCFLPETPLDVPVL